MRNIFLVLFGLVIFLAGCSSTYMLEVYTSKQKYYKEYNNFAKNKKVKITLLDNRSFYSNNRSEIVNDTLYTLVNFPIKNYHTIQAANIKKIDYLNTGYKEANILLKNGQELRAENISYLKGKISFNEIKILTVKKAFVPLDKIKKISYKDNWLGILPGVLMGTFAGFVGGQVTYQFMQNGTQSGDNKASGYGLSVLFLGPIAGIVLGWIRGINYVYKFSH